ncbi:ribonuclease H-like domain-containing protein [Tanacetum coccineum]|uniref:Ribonuclease H-like domain-containing protein n=1 Tax=Tanacetum coccineum TaxID=301880 RepID=A0ABQ4ZR06_9ASTR
MKFRFRITLLIIANKSSTIDILIHPENGNSWVPIPVTTPPETGTSTTTKMTLPATIEEKTSRFGAKKSTKKRQKALLKQQYENFSASNSESLDSIFNRLQKLVSRLAILASFMMSTYMLLPTTQPKGSQLVHEDLEQLHDDDLEEMDLKWNMALLSMRARKFYTRKLTKTEKIEDASLEKVHVCYNGVGFDWSDMAEEEIQANMALMAFLDSEVKNDKSCSKICLKNYEALKKQYDDLLVKLSDTDFKAATYKRGLATLEGQIVKYKEHEVLFSEEIALLKRSVGSKEYQLGLLRTELEKITDKSKKGVGYNAVPSPHPLILNRPTTLDLSYSGLEEFKEPEVNEYGPRDSSLKPTTGCDKRVDKIGKKSYSSCNHVSEVKPKKVRKNNDALIIEDWVSDDEDEAESPIVISKTLMEVMLLLVEEPMEAELLEKATSEESMLWHRRLGHINFKNINKLVKENLVRDLPLKRFENDQTCVACLKASNTEPLNKTKALIPLIKPYTERKNRTLIEVARTMLAEHLMLPTTFWQKLVVTKRSIQGISESSTSSQQDQDNQDCIVMPIWKDASYFGDAAPRSVADAQIQDKDGLHDENESYIKVSY